jgi:hypothetical protein
MQLYPGWSWAQNWAHFFGDFSIKNPIPPVGVSFGTFRGSLGANTPMMSGLGGKRSVRRMICAKKSESVQDRIGSEHNAKTHTLFSSDGNVVNCP